MFTASCPALVNRSSGLRPRFAAVGRTHRGNVRRGMIAIAGSDEAAEHEQQRAVLPLQKRALAVSRIARTRREILQYPSNPRFAHSPPSFARLHPSIRVLCLYVPNASVIQPNRGAFHARHTIHRTANGSIPARLFRRDAKAVGEIQIRGHRRPAVAQAARVVERVGARRSSPRSSSRPQRSILPHCVSTSRRTQSP